MRNRRMANWPLTSLFVLCLFTFSGQIVAQRDTTLYGFGVSSDTAGASQLRLDSCGRGYFDLRTRLVLSFDQSVTAKVPRGGHVIGNGKELQCQNSTYCYSYALSGLMCTNSGWSIINPGSDWDCKDVIFNSPLYMSNVSLRCQESPWNKYCVFDNSCVVQYSLSEKASSLVWLILGLICVAIAVLIGIVVICLCIQRCRGSSSRGGTSTTIIRSTTPTTAAYMDPSLPTGGITAGPYQFPPPPPPYECFLAAPPARQVATIYNQQASAPPINSVVGDGHSAQGINERPPPYSAVVSGHNNGYVFY